MSLRHIKLEDILSGKHLPPFTLGEFENHLVHVQHSAENLYFYFWLSDYTARYRTWEASLLSSNYMVTKELPGTAIGKDRNDVELEEVRRLPEEGLPGFVSTFFQSLLPTKCIMTTTVNSDFFSISSSAMISQTLKCKVPLELEQSFERVHLTFIPTRHSRLSFKNSDMELNISQELKERFKFESESSKDPSIFEPIKEEVMHMLRQSMCRWLTDCAGNSDKNRARLTLAVGAFWVTIAFIGSALLTLHGHASPMGLYFTPIFWLGINILFCGLYRTCPLLFMFGSYRQSHVWEFVRAERNTTLKVEKAELATRGRSNTSSDRSANEENVLHRQKDSRNLASDPSALLSAWDSHFQNNNPMIINAPGIHASPHVTLTMDDFSRHDADAHQPENDISHRDENGKEHLMKVSSQTFIPPSAPTFSPLTKILSPIALRSQQIRIIKASLLATFFSILWIIAWIFAPIPKHTYI